MKTWITGAAVTLMAASPAWAAGWNEAVDGDLSNNGLAPSAVSLSIGSTLVSGFTGRAVAGGAVDRDYFTVGVPAGFVLDSVVLQQGVTIIGGGSFIGLGAGPQITVSPTGASAAGLLGWTVYTEGDVGNDLLTAMAVPALGSSGFETPLAAGTYTFWVQETGVGTASYSLQFNVSAVPELPPALGLLGGLALLAAVRRRR